MLYLLDTDITSYLLRGRSPEIERRLAALPPSDVCISVVTRAELQYGLMRVPVGHRLHLVVRQFLKLVRALPWDAEAADWYATIRHQLGSSGQSIGHLDMMIAGQALAVGATLVSNNQRHYQRIKAPLLLENWAV
jgi:tRNA(fMet)-specific endonuclease VapC